MATYALLPSTPLLDNSHFITRPIVLTTPLNAPSLPRVLSATLEKHDKTQTATPRHSSIQIDKHISRRDQQFIQEQCGIPPRRKGTMSLAPVEVAAWPSLCQQPPATSPWEVAAYTRAGIQDGTQKEDGMGIASSPARVRHEATAVTPSTVACQPRCLLRRPRRPAPVTLKRSNGLTSISSDRLRAQIRLTSCTPDCDSPSQVLPPGIDCGAPSPLTTLRADMGNNASTAQLSRHDADRESMRSVIRPTRRPRSSLGMFKTMGSTASINRQKPLPAASGNSDTERDELVLDCAFADEHRRSDPPPPELTSRPETADGSDDLETPISNELTAITVQSLDGESIFPEQKQHEESVSKSSLDSSSPPKPPPHRISVLSPSLPAPSPLPEDSPHKYGLRDRISTPELKRPHLQASISDLEIVKNTRRRSSGIEIFNETKALQSATSFLNGLSTMRRRAESVARVEQRRDSVRPIAHRAQSSEQTITSNSYSNNIRTTYAVVPPDLHSPDSDAEDRKRALSTKPSGFVFAPSLKITQLKCYTQHDRLHRSRNKNAPVECAVCHVDGDLEHFTCSWCALRMCGYCRADLRERGLRGLRERIRMVELGDAAGYGNGWE